MEKARVCLLDKVDWVSWVEERFNLPLLPKRFRSLSHHIYLHLHKSSTVPVLLAFSITAVSCELLTQHVNIYVQLSSSASGRCHTDRALCGVSCWFVGWSKHTVWTALLLSDIQFAQNERIITFSNTKYYQIFVITPLQYTAVASIGPSNVRSDPSLYILSTGSNLRIAIKYSTK